jgi:hypoxanthine phosphoribosyltransferase
MADPPLLLSEQEVAQRVEAVAALIAPRIDADTVAICVLTGGLWFAADLMRALARGGVHPLFDALWLSSYADERETSGHVELRSPPQRPVGGRQVLLIDDVLDSGLSVAEARRLMLKAGC